MAEIPVPYSHDGRAFEGMLVYDESVSEPRPAILMQPDWLGVSRHGSRSRRISAAATMS